ncbi:MAG TPA: hypothetical protein VK662_13035 [Acidothermaceae bacterium]|nr:hypothetical protein [Acidothermaceae bacterium]
MIDEPRRPRSSSPWLVAIASASAVVLVVVVVALAVDSGRHQSASSSSGVFPSATNVEPSLFQTQLPVPSPGEASNQAPIPSPSNYTAEPVATLTPLATPSGPVPPVPLGGWYFCASATGMATCDDSDGRELRQLPFPMLGPGDATYNQHDGYIYYRELLTDAHGDVERISRVTLADPVPQIVVQGPSMLNETEVSFGSPVSSPDGNFLAYGQMTIANGVPGGPMQIASPGEQTVGPPSGPPNQPTTTRLVQIKIQNLHNLKAPPVIVPPSIVSSDIAADPLLGWSADSKQLFLVGPGGKVDALTIGADGAAQGMSTLFDPASVTPGCQVAQTLLSSSGNFFVISSCAQTIDVVKVIADGRTAPFGMLVNTKGWQVDGAQLDTTGEVLSLSWSAPPSPPQCVEVDGSARIVDAVPTAIQLETTPGCITAGGPAIPPPSSP